MMIDTAVILAAGRGSRLKEVTAQRSKALAPVAGKPIIGRVIDSLRTAGISRFIVVGAPTDAELRDYTGTILNASYVVQEVARGSGDALLRCEGLTPETFLVCACDSIIPSDEIRRLLKAHEVNNSATLGVIEVAPEVSLSARSVVTMRGDFITQIIEKPSPAERTSNLSALPLYILTNDIYQEAASLTPSPRGEYELPVALAALVSRGLSVKGVRIARRDDLTDQNDLLDLNIRYLTEATPPLQVHPSVVVPASSTVVSPAIIEEGVTIGNNAHIGPFVYLERGSIVSSGCSVSHAVAVCGAKLSGTIKGRVVT